MFFGRGPGGMMDREILKPKKTSETLRRFATYFRKYWPMLMLTLALVIASTWAQVTAPELLGQAVDCYLNPATTTDFAGFPGAATDAAISTCTYDAAAAAGQLSTERNYSGIANF